MQALCVLYLLDAGFCSVSSQSYCEDHWDAGVFREEGGLPAMGFRSSVILLQHIMSAP